MFTFPLGRRKLSQCFSSSVFVSGGAFTYVTRISFGRCSPKCTAYQGSYLKTRRTRGCRSRLEKAYLQVSSITVTLRGLTQQVGDRSLRSTLKSAESPRTTRCFAISETQGKQFHQTLRTCVVRSFCQHWPKSSLFEPHEFLQSIGLHDVDAQAYLVSQGREVFLEAVSAYAAEPCVCLDAIAAQQLQLDTVFTIIRARSPQFYAAHTQNLLNQRGSYDVEAARAVNQASPSQTSSCLNTPLTVRIIPHRSGTRVSYSTCARHWPMCSCRILCRKRCA